MAHRNDEDDAVDAARDVSEDVPVRRERGTALEETGSGASMMTLEPRRTPTPTPTPSVGPTETTPMRAETIDAPSPPPPPRPTSASLSEGESSLGRTPTRERRGRASPSPGGLTTAQRRSSPSISGDVARTMGSGDVGRTRRGSPSERTPSTSARESESRSSFAAWYDEDEDDETYGDDESESGGGEGKSGLNVTYPMFLCDERHHAVTLYEDEDEGEVGESTSSWRTKDRMKTVSVALVLCLNIGVDPPDAMKISPCARMQCWINPMSMQPQKELDAIGKALQAQYERWQPRAKYKLQLDPTTEDMKKLCISCRRNAKGERVLLHYNGHGVPRPTANGEIWVFNKSYTQYIPLSIADLRSWTGTPAIYVFDCSNAGMIVRSFLKPNTPNATLPQTGDLEMRQAGGSRAFAELRPGGGKSAMDSGFGPSTSKNAASECILLAACAANEQLPQSPTLPADVFSSCLTTPVKMALHWFITNSPLRHQGISIDIIDNIPGMQNNRKTPLGELNWIFTAITDTIAWNVLPRKLFQKLFRQDLLVASLFRNFLLAERVMRANNCTPVSSPRLPPTHQHPMWASWDMAVEQCLLQMPNLLAGKPDVEFVPSPFFTDQLTAFEVWLEYGSEHDAPPEQLPIVLQVLLSQSHRLRALILLGRFLDLGLWAVELTLSVGIFPYVLKLLQTTAPELRQILVFIWTKILVLDQSCQADLVKDDGHAYFIRFLSSSNVPVEERAMAAFILAVIANGHEKGQTVCMASGLMDICLSNIPRAATPEHGSPFFLRWLCLCLAKLWEGNLDGQKAACQANAHVTLAALLKHSSPDARAAAVYALGSLIYIHNHSDLEQRQASQELMHAMSSQSVFPSEGSDATLAHVMERADLNLSAGAVPIMERDIARHVLSTMEDASPVVRIETAVALARVARSHHVFMREAAAVWKRDYDAVTAKRVVDEKRSESVMSRRRFSHGTSMGSMTGMMTVDEDGDRSSQMSVEDVARSIEARSVDKSHPGSMDSNESGSLPLPPTYPHAANSPDGQGVGTDGGQREGPNGNMYTLILQALLDLALDVNPGVAAAGKCALSSCDLESNHPIMQMVERSGSFAEVEKPQRRRRPSFASFDITHDRLASRDGESPSSSLKRTDSWHQRLANIGSRLLGSPTKKPPTITTTPSTLNGTRDGPVSPSKTRPATTSSSLRAPRRQTSRSGKLQTGISPHGQPSSLLPALQIPRSGSRGDLFGTSPHGSPLRRTTSTLISEQDRGYESPGALPRHGSQASVDSLDLISPRGASHAMLFDQPTGSALPHSMIFKRSCTHFSTALLEPTRDEDDAYFDDEDEVDSSPWLRAPDLNRRSERLKGMYERAATTHAIDEQHLRITEYMSNIDVGSSVIPTSVIMHPFENHSFAGDSRGHVHVWDQTTSAAITTLNTGMKSVNYMSLVNETDDALLLTGSIDGSVKIWRNYNADNTTLVTAWNSLPLSSVSTETDISSLPMSVVKPSTHYNRLENTKSVAVWQQLTGCLYATGTVRNPLLRVWDVSSEICRETLSLQSQGTCLTAEGALLMAGTADGAVLSYDLRAPARLLSAIQTHKQPLVSILLQPGGTDNLLITGSSDGQLAYCDLRNASKPFLMTEVSKPSSMPKRAQVLTALVGHSCARVIASGSSERAIKLWDLHGNNTYTIQNTTGFLGQRTGPVTVLAFHPNALYLAAGSIDGHATIFSR